MKEELQELLERQRRWQVGRKDEAWEKKLRDSLRLKSIALQMRKKQAVPRRPNT